jgi:hypothetical protein
VKTLAVLSAVLPFCSSAMAQGVIVYDNSTTDLNRIVAATNGVEYGDEITLDPTTTQRTLESFKFEYFLSGNATGNETLQLFLRANDGPVITEPGPGGTTIAAHSPGTVLYTSPVLTLQSGFQTAEATPPANSVTLTGDFTWSVVFQGLNASDVAGLRLYNPPTIGSSFSDFWLMNNGTWNAYSLGSGIPGNFAARVTAVPEPTTLAYGLLAGLAWFGFRGFKRRA